MSPAELREDLRRLSLRDRLAVVESVLHDMRIELDSIESAGAFEADWEERDRQLREAACAALPLYEAGGALTEFTALDGEPFLDHESR